MLRIAREVLAVEFERMRKARLDVGDGWSWRVEAMVRGWEAVRAVGQLLCLSPVARYPAYQYECDAKCTCVLNMCAMQSAHVCST
eukprot:1598456-Rhodomonas_salina.2